MTRKNPLTMTVSLAPTASAVRDLTGLLSRLEAKVTERLKAKQDTFTLAYVIVRKMIKKIEEEMFQSASPTTEFELSYEAAAAVLYETKTYPARPTSGVLPDLMVQLAIGLREKREHDDSRKRRSKQTNRPTVRKSRGL